MLRLNGHRLEVSTFSCHVVRSDQCHHGGILFWHQNQDSSMMLLIHTCLVTRRTSARFFAHYQEPSSYALNLSLENKSKSARWNFLRIFRSSFHWSSLVELPDGHYAEALHLWSVRITFMMTDSHLKELNSSDEVLLFSMHQIDMSLSKCDSYIYTEWAMKVSTAYTMFMLLLKHESEYSTMSVTQILE